MVDKRARQPFLHDTAAPTLSLCAFGDEQRQAALRHGRKRLLGEAQKWVMGEVKDLVREHQMLKARKLEAGRPLQQTWKPFSLGSH